MDHVGINIWVNIEKVTEKQAKTCSYVGVLDLMAKNGHNLRNKIIRVGSEWCHDPTRK